MKKQTKILFSFDELPAKVRAKVLEKHNNVNTDYEWWDATTDGQIEMLAEKGFDNAKIWFSGFASQGDGACFDADIDLSKFTTDKRLIAIAEAYCGFYIAKTSNTNHYSHERTRYVDYNALDEKYVRINDALQTLSEKIEAERLDLSKEIYRELEADSDYLQSDEAIIETIKANGWYFDSNGDICTPDPEPPTLRSRLQTIFRRVRARMTWKDLVMATPAITALLYRICLTL